jgi:hypothetical protein
MNCHRRSLKMMDGIFIWMKYGWMETMEEVFNPLLLPERNITDIDILCRREKNNAVLQKFMGALFSDAG